MKTLFKVIGLAGVLASSQLIAAEKSVNLDDLLKKLEQGQYQQSQENKRREQEFVQKRTEQDRLLKDAVADKRKEERKSEELEVASRDNDVKIENLERALDERLGSLKELFGVLQQVAGDTTSKFSNSVISAEYPGRGEFLSNLAQKMGNSSELASIEEIERVWFELQREMTESGKVSRFETDVVKTDGEKSKQPVIRIGTFNLVSGGNYLEWNTDTQSAAVMTRQPVSRFHDTVAELESTTSGYAGFALDPTGGNILGALIQTPSDLERIDQGGAVGYVILALGLIAVLIALERYIVLFITEQKVKRQLKSTELREDNPLGRVLMVKEKYKDVASDTLELKLSEAILKEMPKLTRSINFIKIISVVAPLLGLLGTVTGMIKTFQMITLFGAGDPQIMAGGISQALVTTVQGLIVAIPTVLLFTWLNTRSKNIIHILQEQSAGIIAERSEQEH
ncbi:energy transducer TonB [Aliikangiella marina]|uniref:Energy transducer TonB n=1 Tax=Aliikangiella marina TaxID=1712262 RepID=A0A545T4R3_9GAMM|nr:MotA/TolQ/ExbB proton channel family protein [Aliikangiella marina]TQV72162.1 energy transducer TonB [Aliikangiella marina]